MGNSQIDTHDLVRAGYAKIAKGERAGCGCGPSCCTPDTGGVAEAIGYEQRDLASLPEGTDMGLSCGNPTAIASLKPGEIVVDLGSGGGMDVFLAGPRVGPTGRAIGIDMTPEMISKARRGITVYRQRHGLDNVEFRLGEIEHLPLPDNSADVVISNCVINLSPDKPAVWREIARVLKPGGRVAVSDIVLFKPLPPGVASMVEAWVGCIAGASLIEDVRTMASAAGLSSIRITPRAGYIDSLEKASDALVAGVRQHLPPGAKIGDYITSADITAVKAPQ